MIVVASSIGRSHFIGWSISVVFYHTVTNLTNGAQTCSPKCAKQIYCIFLYFFHVVNQIAKKKMIQSIVNVTFWCGCCCSCVSWIRIGSFHWMNLRNCCRRHRLKAIPIWYLETDTFHSARTCYDIDYPSFLQRQQIMQWIMWFFPLKSTKFPFTYHIHDSDVVTFCVCHTSTDPVQ